jgi:hypothetical protein
MRGGGTGNGTCPANDLKTKRRTDLQGHCEALAFS